ncbi:response regulator CheY-like domain-containing protein (plasmid) [Rhizobium etli 8C-3]|uniref:Response regulator receiver domain-containing protein n=2 Tax=Rhizobium TaxID=379 RepID=A0A4R3S1I4_9HYPH|nr:MULTISPECIES: response regulator [Rhizobium]APO77933.1 response regulator CheY-like domain-containing protein [Rhizobium etli 8C-3]TCU30893.1 response regulator receiver domain-containing protein [Rhizobium azibense]TCU41089.1 response regulator receiver domain-containing protein [Rhizobium azibense]
MTGSLHDELCGRRILVVEDERLIALDIQDILERWGCIVVGPVATATAALALIADECPDSAILDVHLDGESSEPVAVALQASGRSFLVMSAYPRNHLTGALSIAPLLSKPVDEKKLGQELSTVIRDARP